MRLVERSIERLLERLVERILDFLCSISSTLAVLVLVNGLSNPKELQDVSLQIIYFIRTTVYISTAF